MKTPTWLVSTLTPWDKWARMQPAYRRWKDAYDHRFYLESVCTEKSQFPLKISCEKCLFNDECPNTSFNAENKKEISNALSKVLDELS